MGRLVHITRRERFNAAHKLWNDEWSAEENHRIFGKCANENWHGHNYELFVTVKGEPAPETGYCVDLKVLSDILKKLVVNPLDHKNLNLDVDFLRGQMTSTENLAIAIWDRIEEEVNGLGCSLHCVEVRETENNFVKYYGEHV